MGSIANKARMNYTLNRMARGFPKEYAFYPRTWCLPTEIDTFKQNFDGESRKSQKMFIIKPDSGCKGQGIYLTNELDTISLDQSVVAQQYIRRPLLIDGYKFDIRVYVLITSVQPLRVYIYEDGLVRLCTETYRRPTKENASEMRMHLANYSINKDSENFVENDGEEEGSSKRSLLWLMQWITEEKGAAKASGVWTRMAGICLKTVMAVLPMLQHEYNATFSGDRFAHDKEGMLGGGEPFRHRGSRCFEILGVDILLDNTLKPWLIEVNHLPSFATEAELDLRIKSNLLKATMKIVKARMDDKAEWKKVEPKKERRTTNSAPAAKGRRRLSPLEECRLRLNELLADNGGPSKAEELLRRNLT